jgi:hypothetical protein
VQQCARAYPTSALVWAADLRAPALPGRSGSRDLNVADTSYSTIGAPRREAPCKRWDVRPHLGRGNDGEKLGGSPMSEVRRRAGAVPTW